MASDAMTNQEQPDTRPRCARNGCGKEEGAPVHAYPLNVSGVPATHAFEPPAPDTQSGGRPTDGDPAKRLLWEGRIGTVSLLTAAEATIAGLR